MGLAHAKTKRWTVQEYHRLYDQGFLPEGRRVELIEGEIVEMPPQKTPHMQAIVYCTRAFVVAFLDTHWVGCQIPVEASEISEPEPDFSIIPSDRWGENEPVKVADLIVEVSDTTLKYDRRVKASVYAKWGIAEYWIVNVRNKQLEVHRGSQSDPKMPFGSGWSSVTIVPLDGTVSPLCRPDLIFKVSELL